MGNEFYHLAARREKILDACFPCTLKDGGINQAALDDKRDRCAMCGVITA